MKVRDVTFVRLNFQFKRICSVLLSLSLMSCILLLLIWRVPIVSNVVFILETESGLGQTVNVDIEGCCWEMEGWTYYTDTMNFGNYQPKRRQKVGEFIGMWMPITSFNFIKLTLDIRNPQLRSLGLGLRIYMEGDTGVTISFSYKSQPHSRTIRLFPAILGNSENTTTYGFCNQLIDISEIEEIEFIDQIEIKGDLPRDDDGSFVAIDKVIVTRGNGGTSQSLLYTFFPDNWCEPMGIHFHNLLMEMF